MAFTYLNTSGTTQRISQLESAVQAVLRELAGIRTLAMAHYVLETFLLQPQTTLLRIGATQQELPALFPCADSKRVLVVSVTSKPDDVMLEIPDNLLSAMTCGEGTVDVSRDSVEHLLGQYDADPESCARVLALRLDDCFLPLAHEHTFSSMLRLIEP